MDKYIQVLDKKILQAKKDYFCNYKNTQARMAYGILWNSILWAKRRYLELDDKKYTEQDMDNAYDKGFKDGNSIL